MARVSMLGTAPSDRPRISIIGKKHSILTWQIDLIEAFQTLDFDVRLHSIQSASIPERIEQFRTRHRQLENEATIKRVARELARFEPGLVLVLNKAGLSPLANDLWRAAVPRSTPVVGWICDRLDRLPPEQQANLDGLYYFDSSSKLPMEEAYAGTAARIAYLPLAASADRFPFVPATGETMVPALVFVGICSPSRRAEFEAYRALGGRIEIFGPRSDGLAEKSHNRRFTASEQAALYRSHLACFNPPQDVNTRDGLNLRAFEVPLCGGLGTYPTSAGDLPTCFDPGIEILAYDSLRDLKEQVDSLAKDPGRCLAMREAGRQRTLREHTFSQRAMKIQADWLPNAQSP